MLLIIDNYDSFTYNLVQMVAALGQAVRVLRNDQVDVAGAMALAPSHVLISPGPCTPAEAGVSVPLIRACAGRIPLLGVCLGHQSIAAAFGGAIIRAQRPMHGKLCPVEHDGRGVFAGLPSPFTVTRYHSLVADPQTLPEALEVSARSPEGEIMGLRHRQYWVEGVQFHPEAVLSEHGEALMKNFLAAQAALRPGALQPA
jgi:anthranilate synthase/aminodeoxychorismate synthase-like glutamine amidotransferase